MKAKINPLFQGNNVLQYLDSNKHISKSWELEEIRLDNSVHSPGYYPAKISMYQSTKAVHAIKGHTKGTEIRWPAWNRRAIVRKIILLIYCRH